MKKISRLLKSKKAYGSEWMTRKDFKHQNSKNPKRWGHRKKSLKKLYNKLLRKRDFGNWGSYKKAYDYQWELW